MDESTRRAILDLNAQFYQTFAGSFSATRARVQPGVRRVLADWLDLARPLRLVDLGCGNGTLATALIEAGFSGSYTGLDFSANLLADAARATAHETAHGRFTFIHADLGQPGWSAALAGREFDAVLSFAALHHIPGGASRLGLAREARGVLAAGGAVIVSVWQFQNSPKLTARARGWAEAGLDAAQLDPGDTLLDWRAEAGGEVGLRYVHQFSAEELAALGEAAGFRLEGQFYSDGKEGNLALYQRWATTPT